MRAVVQVPSGMIVAIQRLKGAVSAVSVSVSARMSAWYANMYSRIMYT